MPSDGDAVDATQGVPDGWERRELIAGMDTVGSFGFKDDFVGMGGGLKCEQCNHFIPLDATDECRCPVCDTRGIGTVIMGRQEVVALHPEGWFDDE